MPISPERTMHLRRSITASDPPWVFLGSQVTLAEIGLGDAKPVQREARTVGSDVMRCPNCGGPLSLSAPDKTERVTCPNCNSLLDVNQGNLSYLKTLDPPPHQPDFVAPVGAEGTFPDGNKYKIIGAMVRSVTIEGVKYYWHEYLLYNPTRRFSLAGPFRQPLEFCRACKSGRRCKSAVLRSRCEGRLRRKDVQDISGRTGRRRVCQRRVLLARRTGRNGSGGRLCFAAADAVARDDRERDELVARHVHDQRPDRKDLWRHRSAAAVGRRSESAIYRQVLLHVGIAAAARTLLVVAVFMIPMRGINTDGFEPADPAAADAE